MTMTTEDKVIDVYDNIRNLLYYFNKGNGNNDLSDLHHDVFLNIYDKISGIQHIKSYLYKTCYYAYQNWLKNKNIAIKSKVDLDKITIVDVPTDKVDFIQLHPVSVDCTIAVTFIDGKQSFYQSASKVAKELGVCKTTITQWIRNGGVSWKSSKTLIIKEIKQMDYIYNPFNNGIKIVKLMSRSTFEKLKPKGWIKLEADKNNILFVNNHNEGLIVKINK